LAKKRHDHPDMIEEFESAAEKLAGWIGKNAAPVGGAVLALLALAGGVGGFRSWSAANEETASDALDRTRSAYFQALGADPGSIQEPELANPAAAQAIRDEYLPKFEIVADEHEGTVAGTLALFEVAALLEADDRVAETDAVWQRALEQASGNPRLEGLLHQRVGEAHERNAAWAEAAAAHERAGQLADYPLRYWALVDAARCYAAAGESARALELYQRVQNEAPDLQLPPHIRIQIRELQALAAG
jgi:tetratricopeptide (TPR) repeat protein